MSPNNLETAVFAGGCFWCTEAVFKRLKGVASVTSGYANSQLQAPSYQDVVAGETQAAEAIEIKFDPKIISFEKLLEIFWATHDPTTLNRQGQDIGSQYRSAIFYLNDQQKRQAEESKTKAESSEFFNGKIVTEVTPLNNFYTAEEYHQNYYETNLTFNPYCSLVIAPKVKSLLDKFNSSVKEEFLTSP